MSNLTQERGEVAASSASVLRRIIEGWKAQDYEEMGVHKAEVEEKLGLECLILLSELDTGMDRRRRRSKESLENTWGKDWRVNLGALLPKWPSEKRVPGAEDPGDEEAAVDGILVVFAVDWFE